MRQGVDARIVEFSNGATDQPSSAVAGGLVSGPLARSCARATSSAAEAMRGDRHWVGKSLLWLLGRVAPFHDKCADELEALTLQVEHLFFTPEARLLGFSEIGPLFGRAAALAGMPLLRTVGLLARPRLECLQVPRWLEARARIGGTGLFLLSMTLANGEHHCYGADTKRRVFFSNTPEPFLAPLGEIEMLVSAGAVVADVLELFFWRDPPQTPRKRKFPWSVEESSA